MTGDPFKVCYDWEVHLGMGLYEPNIYEANETLEECKKSCIATADGKCKTITTVPKEGASEFNCYHQANSHTETLNDLEASDVYDYYIKIKKTGLDCP